MLQQEYYDPCKITKPRQQAYLFKISEKIYAYRRAFEKKKKFFKQFTNRTVVIQDGKINEVATFSDAMIIPPVQFAVDLK